MPRISTPFKRRNAKLTTPMAEFRQHTREILQRGACGLLGETVLADHIINFEVVYHGRKYNVRIFDLEAMQEPRDAQT